MSGITISTGCYFRYQINPNELLAEWSSDRILNNTTFKNNISCFQKLAEHIPGLVQKLYVSSAENIIYTYLLEDNSNLPVVEHYLETLLEYLRQRTVENHLITYSEQQHFWEVFKLQEKLDKTLAQKNVNTQKNKI